MRLHALSWPGDRILDKKVAGLVRPRPQWFKGAYGTKAPMKRWRAWRKQWPRKSSFASFCFRQTQADRQTVA